MHIKVYFFSPNTELKDEGSKGCNMQKIANLKTWKLICLTVCNDRTIGYKEIQNICELE